MADKTWKQFERVVAEYFHTVRNPLSSGYSKHDTTSDTLHTRLYLEAKRDRQYFGVTMSKLVDDTTSKAKKENKIPVICLKRHGKKGFFILIHSSNFVDTAKLVEENV